MTDDEWLASVNPERMLRALEKHARRFDRVVRFFVCACCRLVWDELKTDKVRSVVEAVERFALGEPVDLLAAGLVVRRGSGTRAVEVTELLLDATFPTSELTAGNAVFRRALDARTRLLSILRQREIGSLPLGGLKPGDTQYEAERAAMARTDATLAGILRCVAPMPFRPITFSLVWRTDTVVSLASQMYESRDFTPMPILADALQDAGCDNADILGHCRDPNGVHVRGCWVVDLVLGKE